MPAPAWEAPPARQRRRPLHPGRAGHHGHRAGPLVRLPGPPGHQRRDVGVLDQADAGPLDRHPDVGHLHLAGQPRPVALQQPRLEGGEGDGAVGGHGPPAGLAGVAVDPRGDVHRQHRGAGRHPRRRRSCPGSRCRRRRRSPGRSGGRRSGRRPGVDHRHPGPAPAQDGGGHPAVGPVVALAGHHHHPVGRSPSRAAAGPRGPPPCRPAAPGWPGSTRARAAASAARTSATVATGAHQRSPSATTMATASAGGVGERDVPARDPAAGGPARRPRRPGGARAPPRSGRPRGPHHLHVAAARRRRCPLPRAFMTASLAAKRAASRSAGSPTRAASSRSSWLNSRAGEPRAAAEHPAEAVDVDGVDPHPHHPGSFDGHRLGQVARAVDVVAHEAGQAVGEELEGDHVDHRGQQRLGRRAPTARGRPRPPPRSSPSSATRTTVAPRLFTSATLASIFSCSGVRLATPTTTVPGHDEGDRAVLELAGGVALGPQVGDLLQLEGPLQGHRVADAAAEEEEVRGCRPPPRPPRRPPWPGSAPRRPCPGSSCSRSRRPADLGRRPGAPQLGQGEGQELEGHDLGQVALGGGHPHLGAGPGVEDAVGLPGHRRVDHVGDHQHLGPPAPRPRAGPGGCRGSRRTG